MFCEKVAHGRLYVEQQYGDEADWCLIQGSIEVCALSYFHPVTGRWKSTDGPQIIMFVCCHSDDIHFKTNPKIPGIDLNSVRLLFETLSKPAFSDLLEQVLLDSHLPVVYVYILYMSVCIYIYYVTKSLCVFSFFYTPIFIVLCLIIWFQTWCPYISLGYEEFRESADPAVVTLSSGRGGHEDLPHLVRVSGSARLQELHPPHHPFGHGHSAPGHQPQQSLRYHT